MLRKKGKLDFFSPFVLCSLFVFNSFIYLFHCPSCPIHQILGVKGLRKVAGRGFMVQIFLTLVEEQLSPESSSISMNFSVVDRMLWPFGQAIDTDHYIFIYIQLCRIFHVGIHRFYP